MDLKKTAGRDAAAALHKSQQPAGSIVPAAQTTTTAPVKATGVTTVETRAVAADPAWLAAQGMPSALSEGHPQTPEGKSFSPVSVRFPEMSPKLTFNDNLTIAIAKSQVGLGSHEGKLTAADVLALFDVTKQGGISPKEVNDAERIVAHFVAKNDVNAPILRELAGKISEAHANQGMLTSLRARALDIGKKDQLPSLTAAAIDATKPEHVGKWVDQHVGAAKDAAPADDVNNARDGAAVKKYVMCPVLGSLIAEGSLQQDDKGDIDLKQFNDLMVNRLGITKERAAVTVSTGFIGNHASDAGHIAFEGKFSIAHLADSILDHRHHGDTGILQDGEFHEDKFLTLCNHSSDGKTLCIADFAQAINDQLKRDGGFVTRTKGMSEDIFEMAALINTFGYVDDKGDRRIDFKTMRDLYQHRKLPSAEELRARKPTGIIEHVATQAKIGVEMFKDAVHGRDKA